MSSSSSACFLRHRNGLRRSAAARPRVGAGGGGASGLGCAGASLVARHRLAPSSLRSSCSIRKRSAWIDRSRLRLHRLQQRELELDARLGAVLDRGAGAREQVDRAQHLRLRQPVGLRVEAVGVLGGHGEGGGHLAERLDDEEVAQVLREVLHEVGDVAPRRRQLLDREQDALRVVVDQRLGGVEHELGVGRAHDLEHGRRARSSARRR